MSCTVDAMAGSSAAFEALVDPTRRAILRFLAGREEATAGEIAAAMSSLGRTAVSNHLRILRAAELVVEERRGRYRIYSLDPSPTMEVLRFLAELHRSSLADLDHLAQSKPARRRDKSGAWAQSS